MYMYKTIHTYMYMYMYVSSQNKNKPIFEKKNKGYSPFFSKIVPKFYFF